MNRYFLFYKPYAVLTQFSPENNKQTLGNFLSLPRSVYPVGRLDYDSEGLLLLTDDNETKHALTDPAHRIPKTYLVQVERIPSDESLQSLRTGVVVEKKMTKPAEVHLLDNEPMLPPRPVPIRHRKTVPTVWLEITIHEGRNRQVRKMTAAVGHPTLRLVRTKIGNLSIGSMLPGECKEITKMDIFPF